MGTEGGGVARGSLVRRAVRRLARPVLRPIDARFDRIEQRLDETARTTLEIRDRVEADLASVVELLLELQRVADDLRARELEAHEPDARE